MVRPLINLYEYCKNKHFHSLFDKNFVHSEKGNFSSELAILYKFSNIIDDFGWFVTMLLSSKNIPESIIVVTWVFSETNDWI